MKITLTSLDATHIGSGEVVYPFEFIQQEKNTYLVNYINALGFILKNNKVLEDKIIDKINFLSKELVKGENKKDVMDAFRLDKLLLDLGFNIKECNTVTDSLIENKIFKIEFLKSDLPKKNVHLHIRDGNGELYIPGSSIKGSLITQLFKYYFRKNIKSELTNKIFQSALTSIQESLAKNNAQELNVLDLTTDLLKIDEYLNTLSSFILVSDAHSINPTSSVISQTALLVHGVQNQYDWYESPKYETEFESEIQIDLHKIKSVLKKANFDKNIFELIYGFSSDDLLENKITNKEAKIAFNSNIKKAIRYNSKTYFKLDDYWFNHINDNAPAKKIEGIVHNKIKNFYKNYENDNLVKIGWGSQLHGISFFPEMVKWIYGNNDEIKENNFYLLDIMLDKIVFTIKKKNEEKDVEIDYDLMPKSRRIIEEKSSHGTDYFLVGWYILKFN